MNVISFGAALLSASLFTMNAEAGPSTASGFWSTLDRNGSLSAGWVEVLPALAAACNLKLDNKELNARIIDISENTGNESYTANLYTTLIRIEKHRATNYFVDAWTQMIQGRQKEACETAQVLWGNSGKQFSGILISSPDADVTSSIPAKRESSCQ